MGLGFQDLSIGWYKTIGTALPTSFLPESCQNSYPYPFAYFHPHCQLSLVGREIPFLGFSIPAN